jgi:hypothetical protein
MADSAFGKRWPKCFFTLLRPHWVEKFTELFVLWVASV